jgi:hypothetical protein
MYISYVYVHFVSLCTFRTFMFISYVYVHFVRLCTFFKFMYISYVYVHFVRLCTFRPEWILLLLFIVYTKQLYKVVQI